MADVTEAHPISDDDYNLIESAVMETARGRWFLAEYARRNRTADTLMLLDGLESLRSNLSAVHAEAEQSRLRLDLNDMAAAIARTKIEIAAIRSQSDDGAPMDDASLELEAIVSSTERATGDILGAAETIQEICWSLREAGADPSACDLIDAKAIDIYMACSFQDITGQRTDKVVKILRYLESRISSMLQVWDGVGGEAPPAPPPPLRAKEGEAALLNGPALPGQGMNQDTVDEFLAEPVSFAETAPPLPQAEVESEPEVIAEEIADSTHEIEALIEQNINDLAEKARATASAALASLQEQMSPPETASTPLPSDVPATAQQVKIDGLPSVGDIEKLSFTEKTALFS